MNAQQSEPMSAAEQLRAAHEQLRRADLEVREPRVWQLEPDGSITQVWPEVPKG
jgi:hypothetical protein